MAQVHSLEYVKQIFEQNNCILLEINYVNSKLPLNYICNCGKQSLITFKNFAQGHRCENCANKKRSTVQSFQYEYVKDFFKKIIVNLYLKNTKTLLLF